jgi:dienelactone hydrolase
MVSFMNDQYERRYNQEATDLAFDRMDLFLGRYLRAK